MKIFYKTKKLISGKQFQPFEPIERIEPFEHDKPHKHQKPPKPLVRVENFQPLQTFPFAVSAIIVNSLHAIFKKK